MRRFHRFLSPIGLGVAVLCTAGTAYAQPINDACSGAVSVAVGLDVTVGSALGGPWDTTTATTDVEVATCGFDAPGVWFEFTNPNPDATIFQFDTVGTPDDTILSLWDTCGGAELICNDDIAFGVLQSELDFTLAVGESVLIKCSGWDGATLATGVLNVTDLGTPAPAPANDDCANAVVVTPGLDVTLASALAGPWITDGATSEVEDPSCGDPPAADELVWFEFTAPADGLWQFDTIGTGFDTTLSLWDTCGGSEIACDDDDGSGTPTFESLEIQPVMSGTTVLIACSAWGLNPPITTGVLNITNTGPIPAPPANDDCAMAALASSGTTVVDFNIVTLPTAGVTSTCASTTENDVFFTYIVQADGIVFIDPDQPTDAFDVTVYTDCGFGTELACATTDASVNFPAFGGDTIVIRLNSPGDTPGTLEIAEFPIPTNDECVDRTALGVGTTLVSTFGATLSAGADLATSCTSSGEEDVWFGFIAPGDGIAQILSLGIGATLVDFAVFTDCSLTTELACEPFSEPGTVAVLAGQEIVVRLFGDTGAADLTIDYFPNPTNDACVNAEPLVAGSNPISTFGATPSAGVVTGCGEPTEQDLYFTYTPAVTGTLVLDPDSPATSYDVQVYADCGAVTIGELGCAATDSSLSLPVMSGVPLIVRVNAPIGAAGMLEILEGSAAANDECAAATPVVVGATPVDTSFASESAGAVAATSCSSSGEQDLWYAYTATDPAGELVTVSSLGGVGVTLDFAVFTDCTLTTELACEEFSDPDDFPVASGSTVVIRVFGDPGAGDLNISAVTLPPAPPNDECGAAIAVSDGATPVDTAGATTSAGAVAATSCTSSGEEDLWYIYTASNPVGEVVNVESIGDGLTFLDFAAFTDCTLATELACEEFSDPDDIVVMAGESIVIRVFGDTTTGNLNLAVSPLPVPPVNDDCGSASALVLGANALDLNIAANPTAGVVSSCASTTENDVFFEFTAASDGNLVLDPESGVVDTTVFADCGSTTVGDIDCALSGATLIVPFLAGDSVVLRFNASAVVTSNVEASFIPPIVNDTCATAEVIATDGSPVAISTIGATNTVDGSCSTPGDPDLWFEVTPSVSGALGVFVEGGAAAVSLTFFDGCGGSEIACAESGFEPHEHLGTAVTSGVPVLVRVGLADLDNGVVRAQVVGDLTGDHVIVDGELAPLGDDGQVDSVSALEAALIANSFSPSSVVRVLPGAISTGPAVIGNPASLWVTLGSFPRNLDLDVVDGSSFDADFDDAVRDLIVSGTPTYLSGGDLWGFNDAPSIWTVDGVDESNTEDGLGGEHEGMVGSDFMAGFDNLYEQDAFEAVGAPENEDWIDQLALSTTDSLGSDAAVIWTDDGTGGSAASPYTTGIRYATQDVAMTGVQPGNVISVSSEFGGLYEGSAVDQSLVMAEYLSFLGVVPTGGGVEFIRGDLDENGTPTIADAIGLLQVLFTPTAVPPGCLDTADINASGTLTLADVIALLGFLFQGQAAPAAPSFPDCGEAPAGTPSVECLNSNANC